MISREQLLEWSRALKSGVYKQCRDRLHRENNGTLQHCCLGVLDHAVMGNTIDHYSTGPYARIGQLLGATKHFVNMNDYEQYSFKQIAAYIDGVLEQTKPGDMISFTYDADTGIAGFTTE